MKKYAKMFNELILLSEKKKKGGSLGSVFKLIQDLTEFEEKIQEAINAQEMAENRATIEGFLGLIDQMYESLLNIAKSGIQSLRSDRAIMGDQNEGEEGQEEEGEAVKEEVVEDVPAERPRTITREDISPLTTPKAPRI